MPARSPRTIRFGALIALVMMPHPTNIRRVDVDTSTNPPTFWVGNNHGASILKVEPID